MNEMPRVTRKGSCVMMIMKISAGSSGARRAHAPARARAESSGGVAGGAPVRVDSATALMSVPSCLRWVGGQPEVLRGRSPLGGSLPTLGLVPVGDVLGEALSGVQCLLDTHPAGDRRADVLGDLGAEVGELGDVDELDARCRPWLHARVVRVRGLDRGLGRGRERRGDLE